MLHNITTQIIGTTEFIDISNKVKEVKHSVIFNPEHKKELEERIVDELCRIFAHKAG